jgi:hypothetical protein
LKTYDGESFSANKGSKNNRREFFNKSITLGALTSVAGLGLITLDGLEKIHFTCKKLLLPINCLVLQPS